jgi:hypothetical protein
VLYRARPLLLVALLLLARRYGLRIGKSENDRVFP